MNIERSVLVLACAVVSACASAAATTHPRVPAPSVARVQPPDAPSEDPGARYEGRRALDVLRGLASYYSDRFAGRSTANGDRYDPRAFTAASRTLPFGTVLRVVRLDTGASVIVRVNDRGPFHDHRRILDLSRAAAERLDMLHTGVIDVRAEIVERPR